MRWLLLATLTASALGAEPEVTARPTELPPPSPPPCVGRLEPGAPPCRFFLDLGTRAAVFAIELLRPVDSRLVRASTVSPFEPGRPVLRSGAPTRPGLLLSGFQANPAFPGLGEFDMRPAPVP